RQREAAEHGSGHPTAAGEVAGRPDQSRADRGEAEDQRDGEAEEGGGQAQGPDVAFVGAGAFDLLGGEVLGGIIHMSSVLCSRTLSACLTLSTQGMPPPGTPPPPSPACGAWRSGTASG